MNEKAIDLTFKVIFSLLGFMSVWIFTNLTNKVDSMAENMYQLNTKIEVVITNNKIRNEIDKDHEKRLRNLESAK